MTTYVGLLRGINVGGKHKVSMAELKAMLAEMGFDDPRTLLQSGNIVFSSADAAAGFESRLAAEFSKRFGFSVDWFFRTAAEWSKVISSNPFPAEAKSDPSHLLVVFLRSAPSAADVTAVQKAIVGPERLAAVGKQLYVAYPQGIGTSKVDRTPGWKKLAGPGTTRNWNTVLKLGEMV